MEKIKITIEHPDGRVIEIKLPQDGRVDTSVEQSQQWEVVDDPNVGEVLVTHITGVHIDIKDIEGKIEIEQRNK